MKVKNIRDPVHGDIGINELELAILDTPEMQRLRGIKQLSFCSLVYPGANHTRFEHSLGCMQVSGRIAKTLDFDEDSTQKARLAALLHDVGHLPFSHSLEGLFEIPHEEASKNIINKSEISGILSDNGFRSREISDLVNGEDYGVVVSSQIDADRMDYLLRDSHYTGVAYGAIDIDRIISVMGVEKKGMYFHEKGLVALESLLVGRNQMFAAVYTHHTVRVAEAMFEQAVGQVKNLLDIEALLSMGDNDLAAFASSNSEVAKRLIGLLRNRRLYKTCLSSKVPVSKARGLKEHLKKTGKLKDWELIINPVRLPSKANFDVMIKTTGGEKPISNISPLARYLQKSLKELECVEIYAPEKFRGDLKL